jgi:hypothetical protein
VEQAEACCLTVRLDNGELREVRQDVYQAIDHGYAVTVHKSQGVTVDRAFVLASQGMDKHLAYVALTRHREVATLYAGLDDFRDYDSMAERLSRAQPKASTLDFDTAAFADRRGFDGLAVVRRLVERGRQLIDHLRGRLEAAADGGMAPEPEPAAPSPSRVDLVVPFMQKDRAKAAGARFDGEAKRWYAPADADLTPLGEWLPEEQERRAAARATREAQAKEKARAAVAHEQQRAAAAQERRQQQAEAKARQRAAEEAWLAKRAVERAAAQEDPAPPPADPLAALMAKWRQPPPDLAPSAPSAALDPGSPAWRPDSNPFRNQPSEHGPEPERGYEP